MAGTFALIEIGFHEACFVENGPGAATEQLEGFMNEFTALPTL